MTEPTDEELDALWDENDLGPEAEVHRRFARAVLAKWGTPAPAGVEPVAHCQIDDPNAGEAFSWPGTEKRPHHDTPLYTASQVLAMGREPLTDEQRNAIYDKHCFLGDNGWEINWWQVIDEVEAAHGIKGGQHGTNT